MTALKLPRGGALSDALTNLQNCDFIRKYHSFTKTTKSLANTFVTTYGVKNGKYSGMINSQVTMDDLFVE